MRCGMLSARVSSECANAVEQLDEADKARGGDVWARALQLIQVLGLAHGRPWNLMVRDEEYDVRDQSRG